ncbi:hypothetical protein EN802_13670 [bacterium M00.F.Ca.ET.159.01.1.1]|nr:hypothetical protein EN802_13670 [bacterium M00.F.Ca.ET.159.01.1.1]
MAKRKRAKPKRTTVKKPPPLAPTIVAVEVDNPAWRPDLDGEKGFPRTIPAAVNVKESAVETLHARGHLNRIEKMAADQFRAWWESYGRQSVSAIDYSRDRVSAGRSPAPMTDAQIEARESLRRARLLLGQRQFELVASICGDGLSLSDIGKTNRERTTAADNLRADLNDLARLLGLWGTASGKRRKE